MTIWKATLLGGTILATCSCAWAGQAPGALSAPDVPISHHDRLYVAEQFSNTVSVTDPVDNKLLGVIRLGDPQPANFSPLYKGQVLVHGLGYSPDHRKGQAGESVLPEYRGNTGREPGLVHAQGCRQDAGIQRQAAVQPNQDDRYRPDHQPRELRSYGKGNVCLCHNRWLEQSQGIPDRRFLGGRNHPGRESSARRVAVR